ncbi:SDR family oxidoreductase [Solicola gregarius]|uniref:NAD(P)H-binding protein n=1 Tax=Solicola gregarius TaxID=2908642 RepID=A0AA46YP91_9ACTN|nr:NAD(P)H-binding protein [Solicola gregarius]UYM07378.1 NAD(P)H-binding protein [Solicola gregarius]
MSKATDSTERTLVTGGTGTLGRQVVPQLRAAGLDLRILSRSQREDEAGIEYVTGDLVADTGVAAALEDVRVVVHLAGGNKGDDVAAGHLAEAAARAGVQHLVFISVIGADAVPVGWLRSQHAAEDAIVASGVPYTILRAAQFDDLVLTLVEKMSKLPVIPAPGGLRFQPVDSGEVADRIVELVLDRPAGRVADLAGPKVYSLRELIDGYLRARGKRRPKLPVRIPGKAGRAYRAGDNLNVTSAAHGRRTWEEFLSTRVGAARSRTISS